MAAFDHDENTPLSFHPNDIGRLIGTADALAMAALREASEKQRQCAEAQKKVRELSGDAIRARSAAERWADAGDTLRKWARDNTSWRELGAPREGEAAEVQRVVMELNEAIEKREDFKSRYEPTAVHGPLTVTVGTGGKRRRDVGT